MKQHKRKVQLRIGSSIRYLDAKGNTITGTIVSKSIVPQVKGAVAHRIIHVDDAPEDRPFELMAEIVLLRNNF